MTDERSLEMRISRLEDAEAIRELKHLYARIADDGMDPDELMALYADRDDVAWTSNVFDDNLGRDGLRRQFSSGAALLIKWAFHFMTNPRIEVAPDGMTATGSWMLLEMNILPSENGDGEDDSVVMSGRYTDQFVKVDGEWKFLTIHLDFGQVSNLDQGWARQPNRFGDPTAVLAGKAAKP